MKVFVTGATGYLGSHVVSELINQGHQVTGLTRKTIEEDSINIDWCNGSLETIEQWKSVLNEQDAIIHCAMNYDESDKENAELDQAVVKVFLETNCDLIYTGNLFSCSGDEAQIREDQYPSTNNWRVAMENKLLDENKKPSLYVQVLSMVGKGGYLWDLIPKAVDGNLYFIDEQRAQWPMVHVYDIARLYVHLLTTKARGIFHATDTKNTKVKTVFNQLSKLYQAPLIAVTENNSEYVSHSMKSLMTQQFKVEMTKTLLTGWQPQFDDFNDSVQEAYHDFINWKTEEV